MDNKDQILKANSNPNANNNDECCVDHQIKDIRSPKQSKILSANDFLKQEHNVPTIPELLKGDLTNQIIEEFCSTDNNPKIKDDISNDNSSNKLYQMLLPLRPKMDQWASLEDNITNNDSNTIRQILTRKEIEINTLREKLATFIDTNITSCTNIKTCIVIKRIVMILKKYQNLDDNLVKILMEIEKSTQKHFILNYYHHILNHHLQHEHIDILRDQFDAIYKLCFNCDINHCSKYQRHRQRQRMMDIDDNTEENKQEIIIIDGDIEYYMDLMDMIHCNILHSYDTGMRRKTDRNDTEQKQQSVSEGQQSVNNKYFTKMSDMEQKQSVNAFDFGYKYYYWQFYRDNEYYDTGPNAEHKKGEFYIEQKYVNIKEEILENEIYRLKRDDFERALKKAKEYLECDMAKEMRSDGVELSEHCQIKPGTVINEENLLAVILYSDYSHLCTKFSSTFRKIYNAETLIEMKSRNSEYWNWSKLLVETVELYGTSICNSKIDIFYHGVSYMTFPSFLSYFCGPTSTTPRIEVAQTFCGNNGVILELVKEKEYSLLKYFNVCWLGCYTNEDERLFISGNRPLKFNSIHMVSTNEDYRHYIAALTLFDYILNGKKLSKIDKDKKLYKKSHAKIINELMKHHDPNNEYKNEYHDYVNLTFSTFIKNKKQILIHLNAVNEDYPFIRKYITSKKNKKLILFDKIAKVFIKCKSITIWSDPEKKDNNIIDKEYLDGLREILTELNESNDKLTVKTIKLNDVRYNDGNKIKYLDESFKYKYRLQFPFCKIKIENQTRRQNNTKTIIRSDLIINRSMTLLSEPEEMSRAQTADYYKRHGRIPSNPGILHKQGSGNSHSTVYSTNSSLPSSQRSSRAFNPSTTFYQPPSKITTPVVHSGGVSPTISEDHAYDVIDFGNMQAMHSSYARPSFRAISTYIQGVALKPMKINTVNSMDQIGGATLNDINDDEFKKNAMMFELKTRYSRRKSSKATPTAALLDATEDELHVFGITNYTAMQIWKSSCLMGRNITKFENVFVNLIPHFRKLTGIQNNTPKQKNLKPFFMQYSEANNVKAGVELLMHSNQFETFYLWFKSICYIIKDFKYIYDNKDVHIDTLFYNKRRSEQLLMKQKGGSFLLRISKHKNKLYISYKDGHKDKVQHCNFTRIEEEIYEVGRTKKQKPILTVIRQSNQLQYLYIGNNSVVKKTIYF